MNQTSRPSHLAEEPAERSGQPLPAAVPSGGPAALTEPRFGTASPSGLHPQPSSARPDHVKHAFSSPFVHTQSPSGNRPGHQSQEKSMHTTNLVKRTAMLSLAMFVAVVSFGGLAGGNAIPTTGASGAP